MRFVASASPHLTFCSQLLFSRQRSMALAALHPMTAVSVGVPSRWGFCGHNRHSRKWVHGARRITTVAGLPGAGLFSTALEASTLVGVLLGVSNSLRAGKSATAAGKQNPSADEDEADGVQWGVMSVISALPWFSGLAWVFAALNDEERRKTYTAFAFLYSLPLLERGLSFDPYVLACVVACVLHVQVERLAQTEPDTFSSLGLDKVASRLPLPSSKETSFFTDEEKEVRRELEQQKSTDSSDLKAWDKRLARQKDAARKR